MSSSRRRIMVGALTFVGILIVGAVLIFVVILPWIVRRELSKVLTAQGLTPFSFHVPIATPGRAIVTNLKLGDGGDHASRIVCTYSLSSLRQLRLDSIRVQGLNAVLKVRQDGKVDLGPLAPLMHRRKATSQPTKEVVLPADRIELVKSNLTIDAPDETVELPITASLISTDGGQHYRVEFQTQLGSPVLVSGLTEPATWNTQLKLQAQALDGAKLTQLADAFIRNANLGMQGNLALEATFSREDAKSLLDSTIAATAPTTRPAAPGANLQLTSGVFHLAGQLGKQSSLKLDVNNAAMTEQSQNASASGINGQVTVTGLAPLTTPPAQTVHVQQAKVGDLSLSDGIVQFQMTGAKDVTIQHTQWNVLGGDVIANNATIKGKNITATLQAKSVDLDKLLDLFAQGKATGKGELSGTIKLSYENGKLHIAGGQLQSASGGVLQIKEAESIAEEVSKGAASGSAQQQLKAQIVQALKDFQYTEIKGVLQWENKDLVAHVRIKGHGRTGAKTALVYDVNLHGLEPVIRDVLRLREILSAPHNGAQ